VIPRLTATHTRKGKERKREAHALDVMGIRAKGEAALAHAGDGAIGMHEGGQRRKRRTSGGGGVVCVFCLLA
jgi:hypothetical protein